MFAPLNITSREKELHYILIKDTPIPSVPMHWHSEFEITYAVKGSFRCLIGSMEHEVTEGNAIISISGEKHYFFPAPETKVIRILFSPDILSGTPDDEELIRKVEESLKSSTRTTAMWPEKGKKELNELISWLASGNDDRKSPSYCLGARGGVLIMLSLFTRYAEPIDSESTVLSSDDKVMERIGKVFELVGSSYDKDITLSAAADAAGYVPTYFSRVFRECTGMTFYSYLTMYRIAVAELKLVSTDKSINEIALSSGFGSVKTFDRIFKDKLGTSPLRYRKKMRS